MTSGETQEKIIKAAYTIFSRLGFIGATTLSIAKEAGVNEVTLFRLFGSKKNIFAEMIKRYSAIPLIEAARANDKLSFSEQVDDVTQHLMDILQKRKGLIAILLSEGPKQPKQAKAILEAGPGQILTHVTDWFIQSQNEGKMRDLDPHCAARSLIGMFMTYLIMQKILPGDEVFPVDEETARKTFIDIFLHGVLPKDESS